MNTAARPIRSYLQAVAITMALTTMVLTTPTQAAPPEGYNFSSYGDALTRARKENKPIFLYFGRYGCSTCRKMHKEVFSDKSIQQRYNDHYILAYVDTESGDRFTLANGERITEMQYASRSRILGTPTFMFKSPDGKRLLNLAGYRSIERMTQYDDFINNEHYLTQSFKEYRGEK